MYSLDEIYLPIYELKRTNKYIFFKNSCCALLIVITVFRGGVFGMPLPQLI